MQNIVVICDEKDKGFRKFFKYNALARRNFVYMSLAECFSEIDYKAIESADIVLVAVASWNSVKCLLKRYSMEKRDRTLCICTKRNLFVTWMSKWLFKHTVVCRQVELYHSIQGLLDILVQKDVIDLDAEDILTFCTGEVVEIYYCEVKKELYRKELQKVRHFWGKQKHNVMVYINGKVTLSDVEDIVHLLWDVDKENIIIGVRYEDESPVLKVCILLKSYKRMINWHKKEKNKVEGVGNRYLV